MSKPKIGTQSCFEIKILYSNFGKSRLSFEFDTIDTEMYSWLNSSSTITVTPLLINYNEIHSQLEKQTLYNSSQQIYAYINAASTLYVHSFTYISKINKVVCKSKKYTERSPSQAYIAD